LSELSFNERKNNQKLLCQFFRSYINVTFNERHINELISGIYVDNLYIVIANYFTMTFIHYCVTKGKWIFEDAVINYTFAILFSD
jgi:hypothetical protein